jgi:hypothetical protein
MRCCARCKTPGFGCANGRCGCHGVRLLKARSVDVAVVAALSIEKEEVE